VVTVKAAALNHLDIWMRKGRAGAAQGRMESGAQFGKIVLAV
jgi:hypothetical protein